jgi:N4-gp56 family major capsid protein
MYEQSVARQLVKTFAVPMNSGKVVQVPVWAAISAQLLTDEEVATAKTTNSTAPTVTLKEHVVYNQITDALRDSAYGDVMTDLAVQSGQAIGESLDTMVFAEFANLSSDIGSTSTELTTELILKGAATLRAAKVQGPYFAVVHPNAAYNMKKSLTQTLNYSGATTIGALSPVGGQIQVTGIIGQIGGVTIIESPLVAADTTGGATAYKGAVFAATAIGLAERGALDMNTLYLPAARATDMVLRAFAGAGTIRSTHGVRITSEGTL